MTELRVEQLVVPGCPIAEQNPLPSFRDRATDRSVLLYDSLPEEKRAYFGWQAGRRVLPYRLMDRYDRKKVPYTMRVVVLENEILRATFWVELGGRLMSLYHKPAQRELLYNNPVFQPANLALRNAWFAGGIEWNVAHYGHSFLTCSPLFAAAIEGEQGEPGLRLYEYDRCKGLMWHTDFLLPPGSEFLYAFTRVVNPQDQDTSMYWWTNIAVPEEPGVRVLAPTTGAVYVDRQLTGYGFAQLPNLPSLPGKDPTYSLNWPNANEFFFQCDAADLPWEAALDAQGGGLIEASTPRLNVRKLWCWGTHQGGQHWQEFLAQPGMSYIEIQAGLAPTQQHHLPFAAHEEWYWTEAFGYLTASPAEVHHAEYDRAWRAVDVELKKRLTAEALARFEAGCRARAEQPSKVLLQNGSGWGALEMARRAARGGAEAVPAAFYFPPATLGPEQKRWLALLQGQALPEQAPETVPGEWLVQQEWAQLLAESLQKPGQGNWFAWLHAGVMAYERFDEAAALAAWNESLRLRPSAWAYRNLSVLEQGRGDLPAALAAYDKAWALALEQGLDLAPFAAEYLALTLAAGQFETAWKFFHALPEAVQGGDAVQISRARAALELGRLAEVEEVLLREFATVREGQVDLTNLWFGLWQRRMAEEKGIAPAEVALAEVKRLHPAPAAIDFRSLE